MITTKMRYMKMNELTTVVAKTLCVTLAILLTASLTGCASTTSYLTDRGRDLADIVTIGVGVGGGAKARIGPIQTGLLADMQILALRGGQFHYGNDSYIVPSIFDLYTFVTGVESFNPTHGKSVSKDRRKSFTAEGHRIPFVSIVDPPGSPTYFTQVEITGGLLLNLRVGFNPGELLDFIIGWTTFDIYNDDLESKIRAQGNR